MNLPKVKNKAMKAKNEPLSGWTHQSSPIDKYLVSTLLSNMGLYVRFEESHIRKLEGLCKYIIQKSSLIKPRVTFFQHNYSTAYTGAV